MKKSILFLCVIFVFYASLLPAQNNPALNLLNNHFAARAFTDGAVTRAELDQIIQAGIRAPSASNRQPWHFTVVQSEALVRQLVPQATGGNVLIVFSVPGDGLTNGPIILDSALAVQSMYLAAQALGLGSRIYTNSVTNINRSFKPQLGITDDRSAIAVIRIGRLPAGTDAVSSASPRHNTDRVVTYR